MKKLHCLSKSAALCVAALALTASSSASAAELFSNQNGAIDDPGCGGSGCWSNYIRVVDLDLDGALDIVEPNYGGFFAQGAQQPLLIFFGDGEGNFNNESTAAVDDFEGRVRQVAIADITGDGYPDIFAPDGFNGAEGATDVLFINQGDGTFVDEAETRLPEGGPVAAGGVRFGDLDGDYDLDIFIADGYGQGGGQENFARVLINDGTGVFTEGDAPLGAFGGVANDPDDVDLLDVDRDYDLDVLINMHSGQTQLWINDGTGTFTNGTETQFTSQPSGGFHYNPAACDVDNDGDLDVWIDNMAGGYREQLSINDGTGTFTDETNARVNGNISGADDNGVACADVDNDGDFDAVIFNLFAGGGVERILFNDGMGVFSASPAGDEFTTTNDATLWGEAGDFDGDGRLDWVTAQGEQSGPPRIYLGAEVKPVDEQAPMITHGEVISGELAETDEPWVRFAIRDEVVNDSGPLLESAWVQVSVDGGANQEEIAAWFLGGDLFVTQLPAQAAGADVTYAFCARDRAGNEGCGEDISYTIEGGEMETSGTGETSSTGEESGESGEDTSGESGEDTTADTGEDEVGETGVGVDEDGESAGCGCSTDQGSGKGGLLGLFALLGLGLGLRRRD